MKALERIGIEAGNISEGDVKLSANVTITDKRVVCVGYLEKIYRPTPFGTSEAFRSKENALAVDKLQRDIDDLAKKYAKTLDKEYSAFLKGVDDLIKKHAKDIK